MVFTVFLGLSYARSSLVKVNKETKEFIRLVIENSNGQVICFSSGPVRAIPRGTRVKNAVGDSPSASLVPDILLWDPLLESVSRWTLLEELALIQIVQFSLTAGGSDIDIDVIAMQYSQLVDNSGIHPKSQAQISGKVISFLNDDRVYKALLKEQVRLNWFS